MAFRPRARLGMGLIAALCACADPPASLDRVEPSRVLADRATVVSCVGRGLAFTPREGARGVESTPWEVEIGGRRAERIAWRSDERIDVLVPAGLAPGPHDVALRTTGKELILRGALTAVVPVAPRIDAVEPPVLPTSGGSARLKGAGLHLGSTVLVGDRPAHVTWIGEEELALEVLPAPAGDVVVTLTTPVGRVVARGLLSYERP